MNQSYFSFQVFYSGFGVINNIIEFRVQDFRFMMLKMQYADL